MDKCWNAGISNMIMLTICVQTRCWSYFCRYFKKSTGMSFVDFLNDLRLRRASQEILLTSKSMQSIATDNGFENIGYFFKLFKQKYGHTPRAYRLINSEEDK